MIDCTYCWSKSIIDWLLSPPKLCMYPTKKVSLIKFTIETTQDIPFNCPHPKPQAPSSLYEQVWSWLSGNCSGAAKLRYWKIPFLPKPLHKKSTREFKSCLQLSVAEFLHGECFILQPRGRNHLDTQDEVLFPTSPQQWYVIAVLWINWSKSHTTDHLLIRQTYVVEVAFSIILPSMATAMMDFKLVAPRLLEDIAASIPSPRATKTKVTAVEFVFDFASCFATT